MPIQMKWAASIEKNRLQPATIRRAGADTDQKGCGDNRCLMPPVFLRPFAPSTPIVRCLLAAAYWARSGRLPHRRKPRHRHYLLPHLRSKPFRPRLQLTPSPLHPMQCRVQQRVQQQIQQTHQPPRPHQATRPSTQSTTQPMLLRPPRNHSPSRFRRPQPFAAWWIVFWI